MLVLKKHMHANAPKFALKYTIVDIHVALGPTNTYCIVYLGFTLLYMKQFLSLLKFNWLKLLNTQHPTFCAQDKKSKP